MVSALEEFLVSLKVCSVEYLQSCVPEYREKNYEMSGEAFSIKDNFLSAMDSLWNFL